MRLAYDYLKQADEMRRMSNDFLNQTERPTRSHNTYSTRRIWEEQTKTLASIMSACRQSTSGGLSVVAIDTLSPFVALLRFNGQCRDRACF
jgi:hypothetical protein